MYELSCKSTSPETLPFLFSIMAASKLTFLAVLFICACNSAISTKNVIELSEENWHEMLEGQWMVEFYAPWCPACKGLQPVWDDFGSWARTSPGLKVAMIDVTNSPGLSGRFMVTALPTIYHVYNGEFRQYKGSRDKRSFSSFVNDKKWQEVEPVPGWKSPNSMQMSMVSSFFRFSQALRVIHTQLMERFGLPTWGSYLIFAITTIILGAILGLIMVCVIDFMYPPKSTTRSVSKKDGSGVVITGKADKNSDDELADEDIKDDLYDDAAVADKDENEVDAEKKSSRPVSPAVQKRKPRKAD